LELTIPRCLEGVAAQQIDEEGFVISCTHKSIHIPWQNKEYSHRLEKFFIYAIGGGEIGFLTIAMFETEAGPISA
jgi:hypothetical protein